MRTMLAICAYMVMLACGQPSTAPSEDGDPEPSEPALNVSDSHLRLSSVDGRENPLGHDAGVDVATAPCSSGTRDSARTWVGEARLHFDSDESYETEDSGGFVDCDGSGINGGILEKSRSVEVVGDTALRFPDESHWDTLYVVATDNEGGITKLEGRGWWSAPNRSANDTSRIVFTEY